MTFFLVKNKTFLEKKQFNSNIVQIHYLIGLQVRVPVVHLAPREVRAQGRRGRRARARRAALHQLVAGLHLGIGS